MMVITNIIVLKIKIISKENLKFLWRFQISFVSLLLFTTKNTYYGKKRFSFKGYNGKIW